MPNILYTINNSLLLLSAFLIVRKALKTEPLWTQTLTSLILFPILSVLVILICGITGHLSILPVTTLTLILILLSAVAQKPAKQSTKISWKHYGITTIAAVAIALILGQLIILGSKPGLDGLTYHSSMPAQWLIDGKATIIPILWSYYPYNAELFSLWFMLPFHDDALVGLAGFYWLFLLMITIYCLLTRTLKTPPIAAFIAVLLILLPKCVENSVRSFSANDLAWPTCILAAFTIFFQPIKRNHQNLCRISFFTGLVVGFAVGIKPNALPASLTVILVVFLTAIYSSDSPKRKIQPILFFLFAALLTGSYWYLRNIILTENPFFPAEFFCFDGLLKKSELHNTTLYSWIIKSISDKNIAGEIIKGHLNWPWPLAVTILAGYISAFIYIIRVTKDKSPKKTLIILLAIAAIFTTSYIFTPYSATIHQINAELKIALRYLILIHAIGIIMLFAALPNHLNQKLRQIQNMVYARCKLATNHANLVLVLFLAQPAFWLTFSLCHNHQKKLTDQNIFDRHPVSQYLESLPPKSKIAWFCNSLEWRYYPYYGRKIQFQPIFTYPNGTQKPILHQKNKNNSQNLDCWEHSPSSIYLSPEQLEQTYNNLIKASVQYLVITRKPDSPWPIQKKYIENVTTPDTLYRDDLRIIWKLTKPTPKHTNHNSN